MYLFKEDISSKEDWEKVFCDIDAFSSLIKQIFNQNGLPLMDIKNTYPAEKAIFDCGRFLLKIYPPLETDIFNEYRSELEGIRRASLQGLSAPKVVACGLVEDKYDFFYMLTEKQRGQQARFVLPGYSYAQKHDFVKKINDMLGKINTLAPKTENKVKELVLENSGWDMFPVEILNQMLHETDSIALLETVYVNGALTGQSVLIDSDALCLSDFSCSKPTVSYYEYPAIVFDLFNHDKELTKLFSNGRDDFAQKLFLGTLLHSRGPQFVKSICVNNLNIRPEKLTDIYEIKNYIKSLIKN